MDLSIREAAALVGRSPRAIRQWIASKRLAARKSGRTWTVRLEHLPLTDHQRQKMQARAQHAREIVDESLPSHAASTRERRRRSLLDLDAFRIALGAVRALENEASQLAAQHSLLRAANSANRGDVRVRVSCSST